MFIWMTYPVRQDSDFCRYPRDDEVFCPALQILLPLQQAKMAVQSYPWCSDTLALCQLIVEEIGEYPVEEGHNAPPSHLSILSKVTANSPFLSLTGMRATPA